MRSELAYCVPLGLRHSEFLSWPQLDQDKVVAFLRYQSTVCSDCRTRSEDWERDREAYIGDTIRCPGCEILEQEKDGVPSEADTKGVKFVLRSNPVPRRRR